MSEQLIYQKMANAIKQIEPIGKDKVNPQQNYKYRGVDDAMNLLQPILAANDIFLIPEIISIEREEKTSLKGSALTYTTVQLKLSFYTTDGSSVSAIAYGEGMDSSDKSLNKAMSAAYKYILFQTFCIPTEELKDSEAEHPEPAKKEQDKDAVRKAAFALSQQYWIDEPSMKNLCTKLYQVESRNNMTDAQWKDYIEHIKKAPVSDVLMRTLVEEAGKKGFKDIGAESFRKAAGKHIGRDLEANYILNNEEADKIIAALKKATKKGDAK